MQLRRRNRKDRRICPQAANQDTSSSRHGLPFGVTLVSVAIDSLEGSGSKAVRALDDSRSDSSTG